MNERSGNYRLVRAARLPIVRDRFVQGIMALAKTNQLNDAFIGPPFVPLPIMSRPAAFLWSFPRALPPPPAGKPLADIGGKPMWACGRTCRESGARASGRDR